LCPKTGKGRIVESKRCAAPMGEHFALDPNLLLGYFWARKPHFGASRPILLQKGSYEAERRSALANPYLNAIRYTLSSPLTASAGVGIIWSNL